MRSCGSIPLGPGGIELKHLYIDTLHQYGKTFEPIFKYDAAMVAQDALDYETIPRLLISNGSQSESTCMCILTSTSHCRLTVDYRLVLDEVQKPASVFCHAPTWGTFERCSGAPQ